MAELEHPQPPTPIHCDNTTAAGIENGTVKKQRSQSMEMRYFYVCDQVKQGVVDVLWYPVQENLGYYTSKHHDTPHQKSVRPYFLHKSNSQRILPQASKTSSLQGCVGNILGGYVQGCPMPGITLSRVRHRPDFTWNRGSTHKQLEKY